MFKCTECGYDSRQWYGKCPGCGSWNTFIEERPENLKVNAKMKKKSDKTASILNEVKGTEESRFLTEIDEFDTVLGGGIVTGSVVLIGGQPGIGKSTLLMQVTGKVAESRKVLYVTAEESDIQVKLRADRLNISNENIFLLSDYSVQNIIENIENIKPELVIIDSIQTIKSENINTIPGTIGQVRECASFLSDYAKQKNIAMFIIAQINKDGNIAGPKHLEHLVDTVLYFDESKDYTYRILRSIKNRFGPANEIGIFEMSSTGLKTLSEHVLVENLKEIPGLQLVVSLEGVRPLVTEIQTLVTETGFAIPQRMAEGFDRNRLLFLLAVLEKKCGVFFKNQDIFVNVPGAIKLSDPGVELGVCIAILSSFYNKVISQKDYAFIGEVGLTGEIRRVPYFDKRIIELKKLGIKNIVCFKPVKKIKEKGINFIYFDDISKVMDEFFR